MDGYDSLINDDEEGISKGDLQIPHEIDEIIDNSNEERAANYYDQYIGAEVFLPDRKGEKLMGKARKRVRYDDTSTGDGNYNAKYEKYLCEVEYPDGMTEKLAANIMAENMLLQVDYEGHHCQLPTEVNDHNKDDTAIAKVDGFIKSSGGNLHRKRKTRGWKLLVE